jgi:hypothetical protein
MIINVQIEVLTELFNSIVGKSITDYKTNLQNFLSKIRPFDYKNVKLSRMKDAKVFKMMENLIDSLDGTELIPFFSKSFKIYGKSL